MTADESHESITGSASPKKHRIILVPNLLKEATLPHPSTIALDIFAIHLIFPPFPAAVLPMGGSKLKSKFLSWSCQTGFLAVTYRARHHYCSERCKGRKQQLGELVKPCQAAEWSIYFLIDLAFLSLRSNDCLIKFHKFPMSHCALTFVMLKISDLQFCNLSPKLLWCYFSCSCSPAVILVLLFSCPYTSKLRYQISHRRWLPWHDNCPFFPASPYTMLFKF